MLKPLTLSVSLAIALGASSLVLAGHHGGGAMPSPQGSYPSAQSVLPSPQGDLGCGDTGCGEVCAPKKKCCLHGLLELCKPKPKCYTYTWVLKKKKCGGGLFGGLCGHKDKGDCGGSACGEASRSW